MADAQTTPTPPGPQPPQQHPHPGATGQVDEKTWALLAHLSSLSAFITGVGVVVGPLIVWLIGKEKHPFIDRHGKEALNFGITVAIVGLALGVFGFIFGLVTFGIGLVLVLPLYLALMITWIVFVIIATMKASQGEEYQYPVSIRFVQ